MEYLEYMLDLLQFGTPAEKLDVLQWHDHILAAAKSRKSA
jgi:hypothetical protein